MDMKLRLSRQHEADFAELLGLELSKSSGNQWHAAMDGKNSIYDEIPIAFDAKCAMPGTKSIGITRTDLIKAREQARGRNPIMPMRWYNTERGGIEFDMTLVPNTLLAQLWELAQEAMEARDEADR